MTMDFKELLFGSYSTTVQVFIYAVLIIGIWLVELWQLLPSIKEKWHHTKNNIFFIVTGLPIQLLISSFVVIESGKMMQKHTGILNFLPHPNSYWIKFFIGFLLLDLCEYVYHVIMHKTQILLRFHMIHHTDQQLDVSTTVREHPAETLIRMCFLCVWVFILGASIQLLLIRQTLQTIANITSHTRFRFANRTEKWVGMLFITPNLHQVHHHYQLPYTDCNYGDILSVWDRLFNTYHKELPACDIKFGIDTHMDKEVNADFFKSLKMPFTNRKQ